ncbi:hypothetical protein [Micropruina sp.]|uniref:hypothetical protein n=1 Tax=Micropruina sp. TaxID=2737536 RepID=UPI0039E64643
MNTVVANVRATEVTVKTATVRIENTDKGPVIMLPPVLDDELGRPSAIARKARDLSDALTKVAHMLKDHTDINLDTAMIAGSVRAEAGAKRLTTRDLANAAGVSIPRMRDLKAGRKPYRTDELTGIAALMGKNIVEFMDQAQQDAIRRRDSLRDPDQPTTSWRQALTTVLEDS